jgi:hypothetical protein
LLKAKFYYLPAQPMLVALAISIIALAPATLKAQAPSGWPIFEQVEFGKKFFKTYGMFLPWPKSFDNIKEWEGKEIMLSGYIIPTADAPGYEGLILSKFTYSQCFFCGKAGLATVAEVVMKKPMKDYKIDRPYVFKGKLKLNEDDPDRLIFILTDAALMDM